MSKLSSQAKPNQAQNSSRTTKPVPSAPATVSARWLAGAAIISLGAAVFCVWGALCLIFWQGSWQLLYHPNFSVLKTPAAVGLRFDPIEFGVDQSGQAQLRGWWIPGQGRFTVVYLHGTDGNLGSTVDALSRLHNARLNVFAFDYRGYGASRFVHPSEASWRQDTEAALGYLIDTRHLSPASLILAGRGLGADLALEEAAAHPELAGVVVEQPIDNPLQGIFSDPRARLVPRRLLVSDRWNLTSAAAALRIASLWFCGSASSTGGQAVGCAAYDRVSARKSNVWLSHNPAGPAGTDADPRQYDLALTRWLDDLAVKP